MYPNPQIMRIITRVIMALCFLLLFLKYSSEVFPNRANASVIPAKQVDLLWWEIEENIDSDGVPGKGNTVSALFRP